MRFARASPSPVGGMGIQPNRSPDISKRLSGRENTARQQAGYL